MDRSRDNGPAAERVIELVTAVLALAGAQDPDAVDLYATVRASITTDLAEGELDVLAMLDITVGFLVGTVLEVAESRDQSAIEIWQSLAVRMAGGEV